MPKTKNTNTQQPETRSRGVLLLAIGHPFYGRMAFNLAVSMKAVDPEVKIAVAFTGDALKELFRYDIYKYFDRIVTIPDEMIKRRGHVEHLRAKLCIPDLTPWDDTLYMDADTIWLQENRTPSQFMDSLAKIPLAVQNRGCQDVKKPLKNGEILWANANEIRDAYELKSGKLYSLFSECMWIQKNNRNTVLFATALDCYDNLKIDHKEFAGGVPDELPLAIAMVLTGTYPHKEKWLPVYWEHLEKRKLYQNPSELAAEFYAFSIGGKVTPPNVKEYYNRLASVVFQKESLPHPYFAIDKKQFLPERKKI